MTMIAYDQTAAHPVPARFAGFSPIERLRRAYAEWREDRDMAAIVGALYRLSDRRLALIGLHRDRLIDDVERMMDGSAANKAIAAEVIALLDGQDAALVDRRRPSLENIHRGAA